MPSVILNDFDISSRFEARLEEIVLRMCVMPSQFSVQGQIQPILVRATARFMEEAWQLKSRLIAWDLDRSPQEDPNLLLHLVSFLTCLHHPAPHLQVKHVEAGKNNQLQGGHQSGQDEHSELLEVDGKHSGTARLHSVV